MNKSAYAILLFPASVARPVACFLSLLIIHFIKKFILAKLCKIPV